MSGAEFIAVVGCVTALVSAYHNGSSIVESIKAKRRRRNVPHPTVLLEESLHRGPTEVVKAKDDGVNIYGSAFANGDDVAVNALKNIEVELLKAIIDHLSRAKEDDGIVDFSVVVDTSDLGRIKALTVLHELYMRIAQAEPIQRNRRLNSEPTQIEDVSETTSNVQRTIQNVSKENTAPRTPSQERRVSKWFLDLRRRSTASTKEREKSNNDRPLRVSRNAPTMRLGGGDPQNPISTSLPSAIAIQVSPLEINPWIDSLPLPTASDEPLTSPRTNRSSTQSRPSSYLSSESHSMSEATSVSNESFDYCMGAHYLQRGFPKDAFKITNQSVSMQGENHYWRCGNEKCVFQGPAVKEAKGWRFDNDIMQSSGTNIIEYRWSFIAKSHVPLEKVKGGWKHHTFRCFICHLQGKPHPTFQGHQVFLDHTASHSGQYVGNTLIQGPLVICAEAIKRSSDNDTRNFDVHIPSETDTNMLSPNGADTMFSILEVIPSADAETTDSWQEESRASRLLTVNTVKTLTKQFMDCLSKISLSTRSSSLTQIEDLQTQESSSTAPEKANPFSLRKIFHCHIFLVRLRMRVRKMTRPPLRSGLQRITWTCGCGEPMYADVKETYVGSARALQERIQLAASFTATATSSAGRSYTPRSVTSLAPSQELPQTDAESVASGLPDGYGDKPESSTTVASAASASTLANMRKYLLLSINTCQMTLEQLIVRPGGDDCILFQDIRTAYIQARRAQVRKFHDNTPRMVQYLLLKMDSLSRKLQKTAAGLMAALKLDWLVPSLDDILYSVPTAASFVKFQLVPIKKDFCPVVRKNPSLPPEIEVTKQNYHCMPCPPDVEDPPMNIPFLHELFRPGPHHDSFWTRNIPKKLNQKLEYGSEDDSAIGWGILIIESVNWKALAVLSQIVLYLSLGISVVYSAITKDASSGFAIGNYIVAALTVSVGIISSMVLLEKNG